MGEFQVEGTQPLEGAWGVQSRQYAGERACECTAIVRREGARLLDRQVVPATNG
jgi:hypothetical protein